MKPPSTSEFRLNLIRKLRNDFAHDKAAVSFQSTKYRSQLMKILGSSKSNPDDDEKIPHMGKTTKKQFVERLAFCICVVDLIGRIEFAKDISSSGHVPIRLLLKDESKK